MLTDNDIKALADIFGVENVSTHTADLDAHAIDE